MKQDYKQSLATEEINECIGTYNFSIVVEEDKEILSLLKNPFIIALKCTIKQEEKVLGIGRANSVLSPKNKFIKNAVLYCWSASVIDGISKAVKTLSALPNRVIVQKGSIEELGLGGSNRKASDAQRKFLSKLILSKCKDSTKEEYLNHLKSPLSSFQCSNLIKNLLIK